MTTALIRYNLVEMHNRWFKEWKTMCQERDAIPQDNPHRQVYEGMCNSQTVLIRDLQELIQKIERHRR